MFAPVVNLVKSYLTDPAEFHDVLLYSGTFLTVWGATPTGAGWASLIAAAPPAISAAFRMLHGRGRTGDLSNPPGSAPPPVPPTVGN